MHPDQPITTQLYRWCWRARLPERHGETFRVVARGALNACLIEFVSPAVQLCTTLGGFHVMKITVAGPYTLRVRMSNHPLLRPNFLSADARLVMLLDTTTDDGVHLFCAVDAHHEESGIYLAVVTMLVGEYLPKHRLGWYDQGVFFQIVGA